VSAPWDFSLAQHIFSAFMWAIAEKMSSLGHAKTNPGSFNIDDHDTWNSIALENAKLLEMAREIQSTGLGSLEQVYLSIIPPLSWVYKLPDETVVDLVLQRVSEHESNCRWRKAWKAYSHLLDISRKRRSTDKFVCRAVAATIEFLIQATTKPVTKDLDEDLDEHDDDGRVMKELPSKLVGERDAIRDVTIGLRGIYARQSRSKQYDDLFRDEDMNRDDVKKNTESKGIHRMRINTKILLMSLAGRSSITVHLAQREFLMNSTKST
jgi:hypothetical protein